MRSVHAIGWSTPICNTGDDVANSEPVPRLPSSQWTELIKNAREEIINSRRANLSMKKKTDTSYTFSFDGVRIIDKADLEKVCLPETVYSLRERISEEYSLNTEQDRAFKIVSTHAEQIRPQQLNLYIGGMGGTGKSQVLRALQSFFANMGEARRIMVVAPTGNSASLVDGSTYHYAFGLNMPDSASTLTTVRERLRGIDYIFFDEISMCSSHDLYSISSKLCRISGNVDVVFGGFNLIFAGDFAQLPPPIGGEMASLYSDTLRRSMRSRWNQEQALGQVAWHMVTDVVILRQNMRQKHQSRQDARFRQALENMRYKSCTVTDVQFLKSLVISTIENGREGIWRQMGNTSIITGLNTNRDVINDIGVRRFAEERNLHLVEFYSEDICQDVEDNPLKGRKRNRSSSRRVSS